MYIAFSWLILNGFVPDFPYKWLVFITLVTISNLLIQQYKRILMLYAFYLMYYGLSLIIPIWLLSLIIIGIIISVLYKWKKRIDSGVMDHLLEKAKVLTAKVQLKLCYFLRSRGQYIDSMLIKELEEKIGMEKNT